MTSKQRTAVLLLLITGMIASPSSNKDIPDTAGPVLVIFDTDIGNDVDDVLALGILHALETRGKCRLLAVTVTKDHPQAASFVDAVNTFYGRGEIPIGVVRDGPTPADSKFTVLADQLDEGEARYPHDLEGGEKAPEATGLLRRILSEQEDNSVVFIQVGFSTNLARLLDSKADEHSPLNGQELVASKVKLLSAMAGAFEPIGDEERYCEYNVVKDIESARRVIHDWPTPVVMSGYEIGIAARYPSTSILRDYNYVKHHPLPEAYTLYNPPPHDRPSWDLTSVLQAVEPDRDYFQLSPAGTVVVEKDGFTSFQEDPHGNRRHLILAPATIDRLTEALVQLCSQPPG
jgi:inosine-uridine nucleoside N-ribohydrolase